MTTQATPEPPPQPLADDALTVWYDGGCPLCRREIGVYQGLEALQPVSFCDLTRVDAAALPGVDRAALLARFHVQRADGSLLSGAAAFVALWRAMPGWRWLGRFGALPGVTPLLELADRGFLRLRPALQRLARRLE